MSFKRVYGKELVWFLEVTSDNLKKKTCFKVFWFSLYMSVLEKHILFREAVLLKTFHFSHLLELFFLENHLEYIALYCRIWAF